MYRQITLRRPLARHALMAAGLGALLGLAACSSPTPARYYTLQRPAGSAPVDAAVRTTGAVPAQASAAPAPAAASGNARFALQVLPVRVPPAIDLPQVLVRSSEGEVVPLENARWLGPLADEIRAAVVTQLGRTLGVPEVSAVSVPAGLPVYRVQLDVTRFDTVRGQYAMQDVAWSVREMVPAGQATNGSPAVVLCQSRQVESVSDESTPALIQAHQQSLARLSAQIAATLARPPAEWRCPA